MLVHFIIESDKLYLTCVRKLFCRDPGRSKVFALSDLPLRRTTPEAPRYLSAMWPQIEPLGLLAWKPTGIAWDDLSEML